MTGSKVEEPLPFALGGETIAPGARKRVEIPVARLPATQVYLNLPVEVVHGSVAGPAMWLSSTIHGDELNGIEIVRQVRQRLDPATLRGTVLLVPIVNSFGFLEESRYLPDRRDLNRSFPGAHRGSLASRLAAIFMEQVVGPCTHGIDLHTGSNHRSNLPRFRADLDEPETRRCALAFSPSLAVHAPLRDGSLRSAAGRLGKHVLLYEAGEAQRYNRYAIDAGVRGVLRVLDSLGMIELELAPPERPPLLARKTQWIRARTSGLFRLEFALGDEVEKGEALGTISDAFGEMNVTVRAPERGRVIGYSKNPLVRQGDALVHLATEYEPMPPSSKRAAKKRGSAATPGTPKSAKPRQSTKSDAAAAPKSRRAGTTP